MRPRISIRGCVRPIGRWSVGPLVRWSVGPLVHPSVRPSHFTFLEFLRSLASLLLPKWWSDLKYGPCPPARDWDSRVSGLVWVTVTKEILQGLTISYQIMSQYKSLESVLKMDLNFFHIADFSKSARWMILFLPVICYYTPILLKTAEKPTVIWFSTQNYFKSTVTFKPLPNVYN